MPSKIPNDDYTISGVSGEQYTIDVDFDSTLFDLLTPWTDRYSTVYHHRLTPNDITSWLWDELVVPEGADWLGLRTPDLYNFVQPYESAELVVRWLFNRGYRLRCLTVDTEPFREVKAKLLAKYFPEIPEMVVVEHKAFHTAACRIDDKPENFDGVSVGVLFSQAYNWDWQPPKNIIRANGWFQVSRAIIALEQRGVLAKPGAFQQLFNHT